MHPLVWIYFNRRGESAEESLTPRGLAELLNQEARAAGLSFTNETTGRDVKYWIDHLTHERSKMPFWAHYASFSLGMRVGWVAESDDDVRRLIRVYATKEPQGSFDQFKGWAAPAIAGLAPQNLVNAWNHHFAKKTGAA